MNVTKSNEQPEPVLRSSGIVRLQGVRVKLHNRRVNAALGPDKKVWLKFVKLEDGERKVTSIKLSQDAAAATVSAIMAVLKGVMETGTSEAA